MMKWVKLGDVCAFKRGQTITAKQAVEGSVPVVAGGQKPSYFHNQSNRKAGCITVAGSGAYAGFVSYWNIPIWVSDAFTVEPNESLNIKYIFYFLRLNQQRIFDTQKGAGVPHVHGKDIENFEIPLPSLSEQQRIVDILDKFEGMVENVEKELLLRQKQYEFYREKVMQFDEGEIEWKTLDNIFDISAGGDVPVGCVKGQKHPSKECPFPVFSNGKEIDSLYGYSPINKIKSKAITIAARGSIGYHTVREANFTPIVRLITLVLKTNTVNIKYVNQYLYVSPIFGTEGGIPQLTVPMVKKIEIPIPYLDKQQEIVAKLDKFEEMISTLKKELELRKKQYEYYREKLLTFE